MQNDEVRSVIIKKEGAVSFLSTNNGVNRQRGMILNSPEAMICNFSVFVVVRKSGGYNGGGWEVVWDNDDGDYDKFVGYRNGYSNTISYGGVDGRKHETVTVPTDVDLTKKHLLSIHWMLTNSHIRVNGVKIPGGAFVSDPKHHGSSFSSIFSNIRSSTNYLSPAKIDIYGIKMVSGYMTDSEISGVCRGMELEYGLS